MKLILCMKISLHAIGRYQCHCFPFVIAMSAEDLHQNSGSCHLNLTEPTTGPLMPSLEIEGENVANVNQKGVGEAKVIPHKVHLGQDDFIGCDRCTEESNDACAFCFTCAEFLCNTCNEFNKCSQKLLQHNVIPLDKETSKQLQSLSISKQLCSQPNHSKMLTLYCKSCKCLICQDCSDGVHMGHGKFQLPCGENVEKKFSEKYIAHECAQNITKKLIIATEINENMIEQLETHKQMCAKNISSTFKRLQRILKVRESALLSKLEVVAGCKMAPLLWWKQEYEKMHANITKQYTEMVSHSEIEAAHTEQQRIQQLIVDSRCVPRGDETVLKVQLMLNEIPKQLSQLGDVLGLSPSSSNSIWFSTSVAKVNVSYRVEVETRSTHDELCTYGGQKLVAKLMSQAYRGSVITGQVEDHGDGTYSIIFTISDAGKYQLQILMDGQPIKRIPSDIDVVGNYTYFNLQQVISVSSPLCVAVDNKGNVYTGNKSSLFIFDKAGHLIKNITGIFDKADQQKQQSRGHMHYQGVPIGIHVQGDAVYIHVTDCSNNCIKKLTTTGELVRTISLGLSSPNSVVLDCSNLIIVSDRGNNRIHVFTEDGECLSYIDGASYIGFNYPRCVALDPQGNIHIGSNSNTIMVFTLQGNFYRLYGDVKDPIGIAIDKEGYSFVCGADGNLSVFHPHGFKVYSTKNPNIPMVRSPNDLCSPQGIALDPIGSTLYVASSSSILVYSLSR